MTRSLSPSGENLLKRFLGPAQAAQATSALSGWSRPEPPNFRCNDRCLAVLTETLGAETAVEAQAAINSDSDRLQSAKADRNAAQGLQFPNRSRPITAETLQRQRENDAERQRRRRQRVRDAKSTLEPSNAAG